MGARLERIERLIDHMRRHRGREVGVDPERREIPLQIFARRGYARQFEVAVGQGAAVAGNMLHHRHDAAGHQAESGGPPQTRRIGRMIGIGAVADDFMGARRGDVENRQAIDVYPQYAQILGDQPRGKSRQLFVRSRDLTESGGGRIDRPMRRAQALDPAAFLIDQHGGVFAEQVAEGLGQRPHLIRRVDIAPEQDQTPGPRLGEEGALARPSAPSRTHPAIKALKLMPASRPASVFRDET